MNFGYHLARLQGNLSRNLYRAVAPFIVRTPIPIPRSVELDVVAYSGEEMFPEQIASIRSFLRHVGEPKSFTIYSDGTHSAASLRLLKRIHPAVRIERCPENLPAQLPRAFREYLMTHPTGKQLAVIMSLPSDRPSLYVDSDVLFFAGAADLIARSSETHTPAYYLSDCQFSGDRRLLANSAEENDPVNTGVLLLFRELDWTEAIARFEKLDGPPTFFTNQTLTHLSMHRAAAQPLDPLKYVLRLDDQFACVDRYAGPELALRHYVNPVRHKFWTSLRRAK